MIERGKREIGLLVCSVFVAGVLSPLLIPYINQEASATKSGDFLTYYSSAYEIRIKYPAEWQTIEPEDDYVKVVFLSPLEGPSDAYSELVMVLTEGLPFKMKLTDYTEVAIRQIRALYPDMQILTSGPATLAGNPAHKIVFAATVEDYEDMSVKGMMIWTIKDKEAYVVGFFAEVETYTAYLQTAQTMIDSFEIVG
jgi:serine/threonine-protein kinase